MVQAVWLKVSRQLSLTKALYVIEEELNDLGDVADFINISTMMLWERMIRQAYKIFIAVNINIVSKPKYDQLQDTVGLQMFLKTCINHKFQISNHSIRGPDAFAWDFYQQSGGTDQCVPFLFGLASQHRG